MLLIGRVGFRQAGFFQNPLFVRCEPVQLLKVVVRKHIDRHAHGLDRAGDVLAIHERALLNPNGNGFAVGCRPEIHEV